MKKIGILFGQEDTFPWAFIDRINSKNVDGITAGPVTVDMVQQGKATEYAVIVDRISQDVPFYRAYLKNAAMCGTAVINNPFWWSADEKFFNNQLALKVGVPVPKTVLLPSKERPDDTTGKSFRNMKFPLSWQQIFDHIGFPAYMKPHDGGGWKSVYKVNNPEELFKAYDETGHLVMMLQEEINFTDYYRCYCIGGKHVRLMPYEPRNPHHLRYQAGRGIDSELEATLTDYVLRLCNGLGYDFNTVELAVRDGVPYAIDFGNPAPDADLHSVGAENFEWVVETMANYAIERAQNQTEGEDNLTWGSFINDAVLGKFKPAEKLVSTEEVEAKVDKAINEQIEDISETLVGEIVEETIEEIGEEIAEGIAERIIDKISDELIEELAAELELNESEEVEAENEEIEVAAGQESDTDEDSDEEEEGDDLEDLIEDIIEEKLEKIIDGIVGKISTDSVEEIAKEITKALSNKEIVAQIVEDTIEELGEEIEDEVEDLEEALNVDLTVEKASDATEESTNEATTAFSKEKAQAELLSTIGKATEADKEDLKKIKGVGPKLESILNSIGIYTFEQVSKMTEREYDLVDSMLTTFKGRGKRDDWAGQATSFLN